MAGGWLVKICLIKRTANPRFFRHFRSSNFFGDRIIQPKSVGSLEKPIESPKMKVYGWVPMEVIVTIVIVSWDISPIYGTFLPTYLYRGYN